MTGLLQSLHTLESHVVVELPRQAGAPVSVAFAEPGDVGALLRGRKPVEALTLIPLLYALCRCAQSHAAVTALEQATGIAPTARTEAARQALTAMETLREHSLRLALDWPGLLGQSAEAGRLRPVMGLLPALTAALFGAQPPFALGAEANPDVPAALRVIAQAENVLVREIFGEPLEDWRARRGWDGLLAWAREGDGFACRLLAALADTGWQNAGAAAVLPLIPPSAATLRAWLLDGAALPLPGGRELPETTPFARNLDDPLLASLETRGLGARLAARLVELARLPGDLRRLLLEPAAPPERVRPGGGFGSAAVSAARGLLIHAVELRDGTVNRYRILPPTRWNFDAEGIAQRSLSRLPAAEQGTRLRQAALLVSAIDPCVRHEVRAA